MKRLRPGEMVQIKTVEELLGVVNEESAMDIEIYKIRSFQVLVSIQVILILLSNFHGKNIPDSMIMLGMDNRRYCLQ